MEQSIKTVISERKIGKEIHHFETIDSTNNWLLSQTELLEKGTVAVYSDRQTAGRGRLNRNWQSENNKNLYCSFVIHPKMELRYIPSVTLLVGLGVYYALNSFEVRGLSIKWPNDVLINGKKVCGILCESKRLPSGAMAIVAGVGINLSGSEEQFAGELSKKATTVETSTNKKISVEAMMNSLLNEVDRILNEANQNKFVELFARWESVSSSIGKKVQFTDNGQQLTGTILGLSPEGFLRVKLENSEEKEVVSGEVIFVH